VADIIQIRRDTAANWTTVNPVLADGEIGLEKDTGYWKVGDGSTAWGSLQYVGVGPAGASAYEIAVANGFTGTESEWIESIEGVAGPGVPSGGSAGKILKKKSGDDYDTEWSNEISGFTITGYTESIAAPSTTLSNSTGDIMEYTMVANTTFTDGLLDGQSLTLHLNGADTYTPTWPAGVKLRDGSLPDTLSGTDDVFQFWKLNGNLYMAFSGSYS